MEQTGEGGEVVELDAVVDLAAERPATLAEAEHRFRSSLSVIAGWSETLTEHWDVLSEDDRRSGVETIRRVAVELQRRADALTALAQA